MAMAEQKRLEEDAQRLQHWKRWGPYLSERQWGTVREDYSAAGTCWNHLPHDHARSRAYRWGEDGLLGMTDRQARLCFALALWNGKDAILKERLFGLNGHEGNHGEDVKELYYYLDSSPTHAYLKALYKYPQAAFPYQRLLEENRRRGRHEPEFELLDTGVFDHARYFDVQCEYAKRTPNDILIRIRVTNHGDRTAPLHLLPTLWFRNTWSWNPPNEGGLRRPSIHRDGDRRLRANHETLGNFVLEFERAPTELLLTHNETNRHRLYQSKRTPHVKDAFHDHIISKPIPELRTLDTGTKAAPHYCLTLAPGTTEEIALRLFPEEAPPSESFGESFASTFRQRQEETTAYYQGLGLDRLDPENQLIARQAYAGLLWTKQFYHYVVERWLTGDPSGPTPPSSRLQGRNRQWKHLHARDIISMPDKWEYPWFAAWDLAFHMIPFARLDPEFAKAQMILFLREWYLHPNGQLPAYEFAFGDVNPPVHAWAVWRIYKITGAQGHRDRLFLESAFQKLLLNFTWWVNRKDKNGNNLFGGGFLGLDNIGPFDRSKPFPGGGTLTQADGTAWMAFYCLTMLSIALELAEEEGEVNTAYEDMASKFFEHFVQISQAFNHLDGTGLWDERDGFYYDRINQDDQTITVRTRSLVGLLPLIAAEVIPVKKIQGLPGFSKRFRWFTKHQPQLASHLHHRTRGANEQLLLMLSTPERLERTLGYLMSEDEFLSKHGIRSLSKYHKKNPSLLRLAGQDLRVPYTPGESTTPLFGGNSNWRGPIWFPVNYLLIEALERYDYFYDDALKISPLGTPDSPEHTCGSAAREISARLTKIFRFDADGCRPCHGNENLYRKGGPWEDLVLFHEYFDGDTAKGLGASHQTGWTALITRLLGAP